MALLSGTPAFQRFAASWPELLLGPAVADGGVKLDKYGCAGTYPHHPTLPAATGITPTRNSGILRFRTFMARLRYAIPFG
ncbi:hypothetical protein Aph01nite_72810 [Acrocarpospora phusangensis]|uniref:Uncharacterized protein n=1 Tax=Acrocarpospora phusangensis TaxID=1070424 RepID=A0A919QJH9_9ACTN|nr:hypothetical protein Aph01nite_72810 [Acrocarpospora phusangensis]